MKSVFVALFTSVLLSAGAAGGVFHLSSYLSLAVRLLQLLQMCRHFHLKVDFTAVLWAETESGDEQEKKCKQGEFLFVTRTKSPATYS